MTTLMNSSVRDEFFNHTADLQAILHTRGGMYDLLRRFFIQEPTREYLGHCLTYQVFPLFPFREQAAEIDTGVKLVLEYLNKQDILQDEKAFDRLHWDYTRLFIGPLSLPAPPWASNYLEKDRLLFQETTLHVRKLYQKYQFIAGEHINSEADDHIGYELDFLYRLNAICLEKLVQHQGSAADFLGQEEIKALLSDQQEFLAHHMLSFVPAFAQAVDKAAETDFYRGIAKILAGYLPLDLELISVFLNDPPKEEQL